jgi:multidrug efflux pump subunit AcrB
VYFQPTVQIANAVAQLTAVSQTALRTLPVGTTPPLIIQFNASSVPILQLGLSGQGLSEQALNDIGLNFIRTQLATVEGAQIPYPYGGKQRQVQVDINLQALQAKGLSPSDVVNAVSAQNLILPAGTTKIDRFEYEVETNSAPTTIAGLNDLPIRSVNGAMVYIHDVAHVRDGFPPQTNIVRVDGQRASLLIIQKTGSASTLDIIKDVFAKLPLIASQLPPQLKITPLSDQSIFVRGAITGVVREAIIAACLTAIMILVFLGSWRSTLIIAVSIPLSIICSLLMLHALGETINIMTLGGLALAVGILVDDATVEIENINRNLEKARRSSRPFSTAPRRSPFRLSSRRCRSASSSCRCSSSPAWPNTSSCRWQRRSSSPCSPPTCCRERLSRRWRNTCSRSTTKSRRKRKRKAAIRW